MSKLIKSYYIGDPEKPNKRGQDKYGSVHCLLWLCIYPKGEFFAKPNEHTIGDGGSGMGQVKTIARGRELLHQSAIESLSNRKEKLLDEIKRIEKALDKLGDNPVNLEQFVGEYRS